MIMQADEEADSGFRMIQLDASSEASLGQEAHLSGDEFIYLMSLSFALQ